MQTQARQSVICRARPSLDIMDIRYNNLQNVNHKLEIALVAVISTDIRTNAKMPKYNDYIV